jgi:hypothetical protein
LSLAKQSLHEVPYKLSGAVAKLAGITFWSIDFFLDSINLGFFLREKLAAVLIIPSSWGSQLDGEKLSTPRRISRTEVVAIELVVALLTVALDIGFAA